MQDIEIINLGDGQQFGHERGNRDKPLEGNMRIISGMATEYIDAAFKKGYAEGKWDYYKNNKLYQAFKFKEGYFEGEQKQFFGNGDVEYIGNYKKGQKDGAWEYYSDKGYKREMEIYAGNSMVKRVTYFNNGQPDMERNFKDGKEHGVSKIWAFDGTLKSESNYVMGKQMGKQLVYITSNRGNYIENSNYNDKEQKDGSYLEEWVDSKTVKTKGQYLNGQKEGKWVYGYPNALYKEEIYKNGSLQESKKNN